MMRGTQPGSTSPANRNQSTSLWMRSTGASHSAATRSFGNARFTQIGPDASSTRKTSPETPPESAVMAGVSFAPTTFIRRKASRMSGTSLMCMAITGLSGAVNSRHFEI